MKKVYQQERYKGYSERKARRALERKQKRKGKSGSGRKETGANAELQARLLERKPASPALTARQKKRQLTSQRRRTLRAPEVFSLSENGPEVLDYFSRMQTHVKSRHRLTLDLSGISTLGPDALLYMVGLLDHCRLLKRPYDIRGNIPMHDTCKDMFLQSGFLDYVKSNIPRPPSGGHILKIEKHKEVKGDLAGRIVDFCLRHLHQSQDSTSRNNFRAIIELMNNTREHASNPSENELRWYLMGVNNRRDDCIDLVFLDNGQGIPRTISRYVKEKILNVAPSFMGVAPREHALVLSALRGEFRTRTKERSRGKGLPAIHDIMTQGAIKDLLIISHKAYLNLGRDECHDIDVPFNGTLFSWKIPKRQT